MPACLLYMRHIGIIPYSIRRILVANTSLLQYYICVLVTILSLSTTMANENVKAVVAGNNLLTTKLYTALSKPKENLIFSPLSLHTILSLVYQGSKGDTEDAMRTVLNVPDKAKTAEGFQAVMSQLNNVPNVTLEIANRVYVKEGYNLKASFKDIAKKQFFASAQNIDFTSPTAASSINGWVEDKTNKKIKDLIKKDDLDDLTRLVLINAIYFKGYWADKFDKANTKPDKFYISETDTVPCDLMFRSGKYNYKEDSELDAQIIELPYKNKALSMVIVLPKSKTGIADLEKKLASYDLNTLTNDMRNLDVQLSLPKFKIESEIPLNEPLKELGLSVAFSKNADFSELLDSPESLTISKVIQKAFIEVNEEGAEAAAATGVTIMLMSMPPPPRKFIANHPFMFALQVKNENDRNLIFMGKHIKVTTN